eukprot:TRINITY_DN35544_c0_g1_i1.p1 TRINITY_DN35544_c0_g1~~TRINITY_DN35544_c0_g1_i1.p1  ORF type:complete len:762 (-),score=126.78 TRINITY_DN35544_c0_g1_i1:16-2178(-)
MAVVKLATIRCTRHLLLCAVWLSQCAFAGQTDCKMHLRWRNHLMERKGGDRRPGQNNDDILLLEKALFGDPRRETLEGQVFKQKADAAPAAPANASKAPKDPLLSDAAPVRPAGHAEIEAQLGTAKRVVSEPAGDGIIVAWKEGSSIVLQRFAHDCDRSGIPILLHSWGEGGKGGTMRSEEQRQQSARGNLGDVAVLVGGAAVVAWVLDGHVWLSIAKSKSKSAGDPVRVSGDGDRPRGAVSLAVAPDSNGFIASWSSYAQDSDGWGIFARAFTNDGVPKGPEQQVNVATEGSQRQVRLMACHAGVAGPGIWALWAKDAKPGGKLCPAPTPAPPVPGERQMPRMREEPPLHEDLLQGPFVRFLGDGSSLASMGQEVDLSSEGKPQDVLASMTLMCSTISAHQNPTVVWTRRDACSDVRSATVSWQLVHDEAITGSSPSAPSRAPARSAALKSVVHDLPDFLAPKPLPRGRRRSVPKNGTSSPGSLSDSNVTTSHSAMDSLWTPRLTMAAEGSTLAVVASDENGSMTAQIFDLESGRAFPPHELEWGTSTVEHLTFDVTEDQALLICWGSYSSLICERRRLNSLLRAPPLEGTWGVCLIVAVCIYLCLQRGRFDRNAGFDLQARNAERMSFRNAFAPSSLQLPQMERRSPIRAAGGPGPLQQAARQERRAALETRGGEMDRRMFSEAMRGRLKQMLQEAAQLSASQARGAFFKQKFTKRGW